MQQLSSVGFMLYMYCISNQQNYTFGLSKQDVLLSTGMADRSYTSAVKSLIDNGFLVYTGDQATDGVETAPLYDFYSRPDRMQNLLNVFDKIYSNPMQILQGIGCKFCIPNINNNK